LMAVRGEQREEDRLAGTNKRRMRGAALASLRARSIGDRRQVNELHQWRSESGRLQCTPVAVIAEITAGIARQARPHTCCAAGTEQMSERCGTGQGRLTACDRRLLRPVAADIGKQD